MLKKFGLLLGLVVLSAVILAGCGSKEPAGQGKSGDVKIKLGIVEPRTGSMAALGTAEYNAILMAIDMVNAKGGVMGKYPVEYVGADSQSNPATGASEAERLITMEKVPVIMGSYSSAIAASISEVCERNKIPLWEMSGAADEITTKGKNYTFRNEAMASSWGATSAEMIAKDAPKALGKELKDIKVAIVHEDGPYGTAVANGNRTWAKKNGLNIVLDEGYSSSSMDLSNIIMKLKSANPDVLLLTSYVTDGILFNRQAKELGFKVKILVTHSGGHSVQAFVDGVGKDADYMLTVDPVPVDFNRSAVTPELAALYDDFVKKWTEKYGNPPYHHVEMRQFAQTMLFLNNVLPTAIEKFGGVNPEAITKAARELKLDDGKTLIGYGVEMSTPENPFKDPWLGNTHIGQNIKAHAYVNQYFNGQLCTVWPESFAKKPPVLLLPKEHPLSAN